jgi:hypothetical protein
MFIRCIRLFALVCDGRSPERATRVLEQVSREEESPTVVRARDGYYPK